VDKNKKRIYLNNVFLKFFGIPFFYLPYLSTSRELDIRVSGPSPPRLSKKSYYGYGFSIPFKFYFFDNLDIILEPFLYQRGNFFLNSTVRFLKNERLQLNLRSSHIYDNGQSKDIKNTANVGEKDEGVHREGRMVHKLNLIAFLGNSTYLLGDITQASDPYVLRDYFGDSRETLQSSAYILKFYEKSHLKLDVLTFQQIRERNNTGVAETPRLLVAVECYHSSGHLLNRGNIKFDMKANLADALNSFRDKDRKYGKTNLVFNLKSEGLYGSFRGTANLALYSDFYYRTDGDGVRDNITRLYPELSFGLSYPFFIFNRTTVNPILQYFGSQKKHLNTVDIDSKDSELTANNLFSGNRYSGHDMVETGDRVNYGIRISSSTNFGNFTFDLGQGYRNFIDNRHRIDFFERNFSHILITFGYRYDNIFLSYVNYLNSQDFRIDRDNLFVGAAFRKVSFGISYSHWASRASAKNIEQRQLNALLNHRITKDISYHIEMTGNLGLHRITSFRVSLIYEDDCYLTKLGIGRRNFENFFDKNDTSITFNFRIKS
jgi:lipopolysaccharide assembly outer membrane protein LptD (OstA)